MGWEEFTDREYLTYQLIATLRQATDYLCSSVFICGSLQ